MERLAALEPLRIITGYGPPMQGDRMLRGLHDLARNFERLAVPAHGRYIRHRRWRMKPECCGASTGTRSAAAHRAGLGYRASTCGGAEEVEQTCGLVPGEGAGGTVRLKGQYLKPSYR